MPPLPGNHHDKPISPTYSRVAPPPESLPSHYNQLCNGSTPGGTEQSVLRAHRIPANGVSILLPPHTVSRCRLLSEKAVWPWIPG